MAIRTVQFLGMGYGSTPATVTVTANGTQIFSGEIPTLDQPVPPMPATLEMVLNQAVLFNMEIDATFSGQIPMVCTVTNGVAVLGSTNANYTRILNPIYTPEQLTILTNPASTRADKAPVWASVANPPFTAEEQAMLADPATPVEVMNQLTTSHNCNTIISSGPASYLQLDDEESRANVVLDGIAQNPDRGTLVGNWWWVVNSGSALGCDLIVPAGLV